jgi:coenzyme F420 hydrogenase subunit beta
MSVPTSIQEVVSSGLCTGCGLCESVAGHEHVRMGISLLGHSRPYVPEPLPRALEERALASCPGVRVDGPGRPPGVDVHPVWGPVRELHRSWAADPAVRFKAAAGGTLSTLGRYLLASGEVDAVLHVRAREDRAWLTEGVVSRTEEEVVSGAQSRYGPSAPLVHVRRLLDEGVRFALIAKPCDISAVRRLAKVDPRVDEQIAYLLTIFCGGVHGAHIPQAIIRYHDLDESEIGVFRYRGEGWPGALSVQTHAGERHEMTYLGGWTNKPYSYDMQFRCKICPDAVGEVADISVPDGWVLKDGKPCYDEAPGRNVAVVRTERGQRLLHAAVAAGYLELAPMTMAELDPMHANHPDRKLGGPVQVLALRLTRQKRLVATGYRPWSTLRRAGVRVAWQQFSGTLRRIARRDNREPLI